MNTERLSPASEQRLLRTLDRVTDLTDDGAEPDEAIAKAAAAERVPHGHVPLLVHAYNTGRTAVQRREGKTAAERAAKFPLASSEGVLQRMYAVPKTAQAGHAEHGVSTDFSKAPRGLSKLAYIVPVSHQTSMPPGEPPPEGRMRQAYYKAAQLNRDLAEWRRKSAASQDQLLAAMGNFAELVKRSSAVLQAEILHNICALHGEAGRKLMDYVESRNGTIKAAASNGFRPARGLVYELAGQCLAAAEAAIGLRNKYAEVAAESRQEVGQLLSPFAQSRGGLLEGLSSPRTKTATIGVGGYAVGSGLSMAAYDLIKDTLGGVPLTSPPDTAREVSKQVLELEDPAHQAELQRIQSEAMLNDLISNDEVISGHNPEEVVSAYNEISQMAPRAAHQGMWVRAMLRKRLAQGGLDQFEMSDIFNTEERLRKLDEPAGFKGEDYGTILPTARPAPPTAPTMQPAAAPRKR